MILSQKKESERTLKVLVVDDSAIVRRVISAIISQEKSIEADVITAPDPIIALKKMETQTPDIIILDLEMPKMDGLTFLKKVMKENPVPVIICSGQAEKGTDNAFKALEMGAVDIITKPKVGIKEFLLESSITLVDTVKAATQARIGRRKNSPSQAAPAIAVVPKLTADAVEPLRRNRIECAARDRLIAIGASTGGVEALHSVLTSLPADTPGVVVVQHMPAGFTRAFADRLNQGCRIEVKEAANGDEVFRGRALIAPGDRHMAIRCRGQRYFAEIIDGPLVSRHRPSVDVLFRSVAQSVGGNAVGLIMTGMGDDGARGLLEMKLAGAKTIGQDEKSCIVYGMPKAARDLGAVDKSVNLSQIPQELANRTLK